MADAGKRPAGFSAVFSSRPTMALFALLCALLLEQVHPLPVRNPVYALHRAWTDAAVRNLDTGKARHGWVVWAAAVLVPTLGAALIYLLLLQVAWPLAWGWAAVVLYLTLGFRQFSHHVTAIRDALDLGDEVGASQLLAQWKQVDATGLPRSGIVRQVLEHAVRDAHRHVFGVMVAFIVCAAFGLGPAGAVLFRTAEYVARYWRQQQDVPVTGVTVSPRTAALAQFAWHWINWLPARASAAVFAVAGNFEQAVDNWRQQTMLRPSESTFLADTDAVVLAAAMGAVDLPWPLPDSVAEQKAVAGGAFATPGAIADPTLFEEQHDSAGAAAEAERGSAPVLQMRHVQLLAGLVWRAVVVWGGLIALVAVTHWVS